MDDFYFCKRHLNDNFIIYGKSCDLNKIVKVFSMYHQSIEFTVELKINEEFQFLNDLL